MYRTLKIGWFWVDEEYWKLLKLYDIIFVLTQLNTTNLYCRPERAVLPTIIRG